MKPLLTVGLPIYNSKSIAWLSIESLINQVNVDFEWELLVCEENFDEYLGEEEIQKYAERLSAAGCVRIKYIALHEKKSLSEKWRIMGQHISATSQVFSLLGCDDYAYPYFLADAYKAIYQEGYDRSQVKKVLFYYIQNAMKMVFNYDNIATAHEYPTGIWQSTRSEYIRNLPDEEVFSGVDSWICRNSVSKLEYRIKWIAENTWDKGLCTDGHNVISTWRRNLYYNPTTPFEKTTLKIKNILPGYVYEKLFNMNEGIYVPR